MEREGEGGRGRGRDEGRETERMERGKRKEKTIISCMIK